MRNKYELLKDEITAWFKDTLEGLNAFQPCDTKTQIVKGIREIYKQALIEIAKLEATGSPL